MEITERKLQWRTLGKLELIHCIIIIFIMASTSRKKINYCGKNAKFTEILELSLITGILFLKLSYVTSIRLGFAYTPRVVMGEC